MEIFKEIAQLETEQKNPATEALSELNTLEILKVINEEDKKVAYAVEKALPDIAKAVDIIVDAIKRGGKWFYVGAGTSGRLGVIDVAELLPTYNVGPETVEAIIAGGPGAMLRPIEAAEDDEEMAIRELKGRRLSSRDVVVGISASGRTPFVVASLRYAKEIGAKTVCITSVLNSPITKFADIKIILRTGPEVITGSTRMKAATAQKMTLTMLSTAIMVRLGRVHGNLMVALQPVSKKLKERAKRILMMETGVDYETATRVLEQSDYNVIAGIVMVQAGIGYEDAIKFLKQVKWIPTKAIELAKQMKSSGEIKDVKY
ncbi:MAG: N-acetylmuramic acid 6-phosphate etherase [Thermofilum sp. ex4484_79]|nr:MAG: N-acetylmuramic acid 6-phosphate etherase [Thermofilum sp. ex4484_79]